MDGIWGLGIGGHLETNRYQKKKMNQFKYVAYILGLLAFIPLNSALRKSPIRSLPKLKTPSTDSFPVLTRSASALSPSAAPSVQEQKNLNSLLPTEEFVLHLNNAIISQNLIQFRLQDNKFNASNVREKSLLNDADLSFLTDLKSVQGRLVKLSAGIHLQLTFSYKTNDIVKNFNLLSASEECRKLLCRKAFRLASLSTSSCTYELNLKRGKGKFRVVPNEKSNTTIEIYENNIPKKGPIDPFSPFLCALNITTSEGKVKSGMASKYSQIQKFIEILDKYLLKKEKDLTPLRIVDMGCGLGYLTFAAHHRYHTLYKLSTVGIEARVALVEKTNAVASALNFNTLTFVEGTIESVDVEDGVDVLVALHACDMATDSALWKGIQNKAEVMIVAPCCQKEVQ